MLKEVIDKIESKLKKKFPTFGIEAFGGLDPSKDSLPRITIEFDSHGDLEEDADDMLAVDDRISIMFFAKATQENIEAIAREYAFQIGAYCISLEDVQPACAFKLISVEEVNFKPVLKGVIAYEITIEFKVQYGESWWEKKPDLLTGLVDDTENPAAGILPADVDAEIVREGH